MASNCWASGLCGAIAVPNTAQTIQNSRISAPMMNVGLRSSSRHGGSWRRRAAWVTAVSTPGPGVGGPSSLIRTPPRRSRGLSMV